jgi:SRSO17 transposase
LEKLPVRSEIGDIMGMEYLLDRKGERRLAAYFDRIGDVLRTAPQRTSFATYALGLMGDGERKSAEPMAARACPNPDLVDAAHQRLTYFTRDAEWPDGDVRREAARYALAAMTARGPVTDWIIDDTGFPKQGTHSVGVQRQYSGTLGKIANCQVAASLTIATRTEHVPVDFALYLPESWTENPTRRAEAHIPEEVRFKSKPELGLEMIERAVADGLPTGLVLVDSAYGDNAEFRRRVRCEGLDYAVGLHSTTTVWRLDSLGRRIGDPVAVGDLAIAIGRRGFRRVTWREGTKGKMSSRFAVERVVLAQDDLVDPSKREAVWLVMEWPDGEEGPTDFTATTLPATMTRRQLVRRIKQRWRTERVYEDAKGELGLDHYEGRSFRGWNHHVSIVLVCFAFIVAERSRAFPPSTGKTAPRKAPHRHDCADDNSPGAALPGFLHHRAPGRRARPDQVVTPLPSMSPKTSDGTAWCTCQ